MLDALAKRYGNLPSAVLTNADSFDLMVFDVAVTYEKLQVDKANKKVDSSMYSQDELKEMLEKGRSKKWCKSE